MIQILECNTTEFVSQNQWIMTVEFWRECFWEYDYRLIFKGMFVYEKKKIKVLSDELKK